MRIRKNTKLSSMLLATTGFAGEIPETYLCQLNQSPWDVIPVTTFSGGDDNELTNILDSYWFLPPSSSSSSSSSPRIHKFNGEEDKLNGINVSFSDTNGVSERLNNLVSVEKSKSPEVKESVKSKPVELDLKTPGDDDEKMVVSMPAPPKRGRPRGTTTKKTPATATVTLTANPYEFYYYSGFGPRWGRKRGGGSNGGSGGENNMSKKSSSSSSSSSDDNGEEDDNKMTAFGSGSNGFDGFDFMEEDYDDDQEEESDDDDDDDHKKRKKKVLMMKKKMRKRKPVKERSLKSLM